MRSRKMYFCEQCSRLDWRERSTKRFCSNACKQAHKRGTAPVVYWKKSDEKEVDHYERFVQEILVAEKHDVAAQLQRCKNQYGVDAMYMLIDTLRMVIE